MPFDNKPPRRTNEHNNSFTQKKSREFRTDNYQQHENYDEAEKNDLIIGRNPVLEALKSNARIDHLYVSDDHSGSLPHICALAKEKGIVVKTVNNQKLDKLSGGKSHQGVIASGTYADYLTLDQLLEKAFAETLSPLIVVCDEIEDPHNLGAIMRTAEAAGANGVIIPKHRAASLNATVFKTSAGAASWLPTARVANLSAALDEMKKRGFWIYGADALGQPYTSSDLTGSAAIVIGSEGSGLGRLIKAKCDFLLSLPMKGKITSLNASVAAGIFLYEALRQRDSKNNN